MRCAIAWFGIAALLGGWAERVMLVLFGTFVVVVVARGYHRRSNELREEWRRGDGPDEFR